MDAVGVLLAAGAGSRYGSPKALAHGGAWLRVGVTALRDGGCTQVVVVLGARAADAGRLVPPHTQVVVAPDWARGMSASLRAGLAAAEATSASRVVLHLVDTPDVGADVVARVLAAGAPLARATYGGKGGHPVVLARAHWAPVAERATGDHGARSYLAGRADVVAVECGDLATGLDIDTPDGAAEADSGRS
ncbi:MAG: nucleotidyltransferase family protein [Mycobacteriaceae bacterium]